MLKYKIPQVFTLTLIMCNYHKKKENANKL